LVDQKDFDVAKPKPPPAATDDEFRALLQRHRCPVPFHEVRAHFLGAIATPATEPAPMEMVSTLWGGKLPAFDTLDAVNELIGPLVMGLWNRLRRHQERSAPFRLTRIEVPSSRDGLAAFARMRREELDGFIAGLFGASESVDLPERAHKALGVLAEVRAMVEGVHELAGDRSRSPTHYVAARCGLKRAEWRQGSCRRACRIVLRRRESA
jgi:hypothetical protein